MSELTDDEIRVKVAEILGWHHIYSDGPPENELFGYEKWDREPDEDGKPLPNWPASVDAALTLCDRLREEGWTVQFYRHPRDQWRVELRRYAEDEWPYIEDPSLARAVCLAFLRVKGLDSVARSL